MPLEFGSKHLNFRRRENVNHDTEMVPSKKIDSIYIKWLQDFRKAHE